MGQAKINSVLGDYYSALTTMEWGRWVSLFSADAVRHDPGGQEHVGEEGLKQFISGIGSLFEPVIMRADNTYITDYGTAVRWVGSGMGRNGKSVEFSGIDVFKINESGKIIDQWVYWGPAPVISELSS